MAAKDAIPVAQQRRYFPNGSTATPIVALGGSAGSFKGMTDFIRMMPPHCDMAFVVITHLNPNRLSTLR